MDTCTITRTPASCIGGRSATLHQGEAVDVLRAHIAARSVDLVYLDPPYFTQANWTGKAGTFTDTWVWAEEAERDLADLRERSATAATMVEVIAGRAPLGAYLAAMGRLFVELRRVLKLTGCVFVQADDHAIHGLRVLLDAVFGREMWMGDLLWHRSDGSNAVKDRFGRVHDTITCYARTQVHRWRCFRFPDTGIREGGKVEVRGVVRDRLHAGAKERVGYPTQKPLALLNRIILGASLPGDVVLDPVMGSGTAVVAAVSNGRQTIGIDRSPDALATARKRLSDLNAQKSIQGKSLRRRADAAPDLFDMGRAA